jgi:hypothetical protein
MPRPENKSVVRSLSISLLISTTVLLAGMMVIDDLNFGKVCGRLLWPLLRLILLILLGLLIGQVIEASGWTKTLAIFARPFFRFSNLGNRCSAAFTAAFFSGVASNAMLLDFFKEGKISRQQLYLSNFINQLPAFFLHLPTTFFIIIPLTGWAGVLYLGITLGAAIFRTGLFLFYGHLRVSPGSNGYREESSHFAWNPNNRFKDIWKQIKSRLPHRLMAIIVYVVPIYILVFLSNAMGLFTILRERMAHFVVTTFMPMESLSVIMLSFAAEFTSGFAAAGALLDAGILTVKQTVIALLLGNILAFPIRALRHQLPRYIGIFSPKMGTELLLMGQGFRVASLICVGAVYYCFA